MAPVVCAIVPIYRKDEEKQAVIAACKVMLRNLCGEAAVTQAESRLGQRDILTVFFGPGHSQQVLLDLRDSKPVDKHFYWEQRGVPFRLEVGPKDVANNACVLKNRLSRDKEFLQQSDLSESWLREKMEALQAELHTRAKTRTHDNTTTVDSYDELKKALAERSGFVRCWFNPSPGHEKTIKDETKGTVRCIPLDQPEGQTGQCIYTGEPASQQVIFSVAY
jgi:prolyl-tRNA synthetase